MGYQVSPTSDPAATTMVLAASASTASAAIQMTVEAGRDGTATSDGADNGDLTAAATRVTAQPAGDAPRRAS